MADELTRRIEVCLQNWADDQAEGRPYYDPHDQWAACIEVLQEVHKTRATPEPSEADETLTMIKRLAADMGIDVEAALRAKGGAR